MRKSPPFFIYLLANFLAFGLVDHLYLDGRIGRIGYLSIKAQADRINSVLGRLLHGFFP